MAAWFHFYGNDRSPPDGSNRRLARILQSPLAIASWLLVVFEVLSLTLGMIDLWPAWSNGRSNLGAIAGKGCGLADYVMVEQDANAGMLTPIGATPGDALGGPTTEGFGPNNIPTNLSADEVTGGGPGTSSNFADSAQGDEDTTNQSGTEGGTTAAVGINGSRARLPFGLDPARTPVMSSWRSGTQQPAVLRSAWYRLPADWSERDRSSSILVVAAAGRFDGATSSCNGLATTASRRVGSGSPTSVLHRHGGT